MSGAQSQTIVDHAHFARQTFGDATLQAELIALFSTSAKTYFAQLAQSKQEEDWFMAAHALKGAALNMGAMALSALCKTAEKATTTGEREALVTEIGDALTATLHEFATALAGGDGPPQ